MNRYRKGYRGETELADALSRLLGVTVKRGASPYLPGFLARDVIGLPGLHIECKRRERLCFTAALRQARRDAGGYLVPIIAHRANHEAWLITMELRDLPKLARIIHGLVNRAGVTDDNGAVKVTASEDEARLDSGRFEGLRSRADRISDKPKTQNL